MLFADDLVKIWEESRLELEQQLGIWREVPEGKRLNITRKKIEYRDQQDPVKKFAYREYQYHAPSHSSN